MIFNRFEVMKINFLIEYLFACSIRLLCFNYIVFLCKKGETPREISED